MRKEILTVLMLAAVGYCSACGDSCLQEIAFNPFGINVGQMRSIGPEGIRKVFGAPCDTVKDTISNTLCYKYKDKEFSFMGNSVFLLEVFGGEMGCLKMGMSKKRFERDFGPLFSLGLASSGIETRSYADDHGKEFKLNLEFEKNRLVRVVPDWSEVFE
jgi:hypothetical protein